MKNLKDGDWDKEIQQTIDFIKEANKVVGTPDNVIKKAIEVIPLITKFGDNWINTGREKHAIGFYIGGNGNGKIIHSAVFLNQKDELKFYLNYEEIDPETDEFLFEEIVDNPIEEDFDKCIEWLKVV